MFSKKSLVLIGMKNENEKAVLSLEKKGDMFEGRVRLYNFSSEPCGILSIGFYLNGKVLKAGLSRVSSNLYNFKTDILDLEEDFSCAVVNFYEGELKPLLYGSTKALEDNVEKIGKLMTEEFNEKVSVKKVEKVLDENGIDYDENLKEEIENEIDKNLCRDCLNCSYRKAFYEKEKQVRKNDVEDVEKNFFDEIKTQVDGLFEKNEREEFLEKIIPNSKWVKVEYEQSGDYYILGLIYDEDRLKYIVYGVPGVYQKDPPKELSGYPIWLPLDEEKRESFGYWLSYQDAETGESVRAVVE